MARAKKAAKVWNSGNYVYDETSAARIQQIASELAEAFSWDDAREPDGYWPGVYEKLERIAAGVAERVNGKDPSKL